MIRHAAPIVLAAVAIAAAGFKLAASPAEQLQTFAETFLQTLDDDQLSIVTKPFDDPSRPGWHFIPKESRKGLAIGQMNDAQRTTALRMVRAALSESGYRKVDQIRVLESVVADLEGPDRRWSRSSDAYHLTIFGRPTATGSWAMSLEGHHVSINVVCRDGKVVDTTPQFLGTHPATVPIDYTADHTTGDDSNRRSLPGGTRILAAEEDLGFELIGMLSADQRRLAIVDDTAPPETRFAGQPQPVVDDSPMGIPHDQLTAGQQTKLMQLINLYLDVAADPIADARRQTIQSAGLDNLHFAWMGATEPGIGHYYRITGPTLLIELVNSQPDALGTPANHLHCVLRDLTGDFDLPLN